MNLTFAIRDHGATPVPAEDCAVRDASKYTTVDRPGGKPVSVLLCFIAHRSDEGSYLIPYRRVVTSSNPEAARLYADFIDARRRGASVDASKLFEQIAGIPIGPSEPTSTWMRRESDNEVQKYMAEVAGRFRLRVGDTERLEKLKRERQKEEWKMALQFVFGGLFIGWVGVSAVGWVMRGFLGIPRGADMRPDR